MKKAVVGLLETIRKRVFRHSRRSIEMRPLGEKKKEESSEKIDNESTDQQGVRCPDPASLAFLSSAAPEKTNGTMEVVEVSSPSTDTSGQEGYDSTLSSAEWDNTTRSIPADSPAAFALVAADESSVIEGGEATDSFDSSTTEERSSPLAIKPPSEDHDRRESQEEEIVEESGVEDTTAIGDAEWSAAESCGEWEDSIHSPVTASFATPTAAETPVKVDSDAQPEDVPGHEEDKVPYEEESQESIVSPEARAYNLTTGSIIDSPLETPKVDSDAQSEDKDAYVEESFATTVSPEARAYNLMTGSIIDSPLETPKVDSDIESQPEDVKCHEAEEDPYEEDTFEQIAALQAQFPPRCPQWKTEWESGGQAAGERRFFHPTEWKQDEDGFWDEEPLGYSDPSLAPSVPSALAYPALVGATEAEVRALATRLLEEDPTGGGGGVQMDRQSTTSEEDDDHRNAPQTPSPSSSKQKRGGDVTPSAAVATSVRTGGGGGGQKKKGPKEKRQTRKDKKAASPSSVVSTPSSSTWVPRFIDDSIFKPDTYEPSQREYLLEWYRKTGVTKLPRWLAEETVVVEKKKKDEAGRGGQLTSTPVVSSGTLTTLPSPGLSAVAFGSGRLPSMTDYSRRSEASTLSLDGGPSQLSLEQQFLTARERGLIQVNPEYYRMTFGVELSEEEEE